MEPLSRRDFLHLGLAAPLALAWADDPRPANVHQQLLDIAARQEEQRRARFAAVKSNADLEALQKELRESFLRLLDGLPEAREVPPAKITGTIEGDDYVIEKLALESFPGYFVSALLSRPKKAPGPLPGVISPCGHSAVGKAAAAYQVLHVNLAKRGYVVLTYDPVGQGERSQFWDAQKGRSRFNLTCGEHAVLGNPLYLLGTSLARYRIWDGIRAIDYLSSLREVDPKRIGCVGNSGGGTLTAYIAALDPRVSVAASCCYITTLPRRMANRIQTDPDADPEQDIARFVSAGIDHAGLLALRAPRPTLVGSAKLDFFPIEGARESVAEAKRLYEVAGVPERITQTVADEKHGLTLPLRKAVYGWFDRWLAGREGRTDEVMVEPRAAKDLQVCADGQVNLSFKSRPLLPLAREEFAGRAKRGAVPLRELLRLDPELADFRLTEITAGGKTLVVCVNGNESRGWQEEKELLRELGKRHAVMVVDPRGVGPLRPALEVKGHDYADPLCGVEENVAYNAFLVGKSLLGMRVTDVLSAVRKQVEKAKPSRVVLCGRADAALVVCLAAAIEKDIAAVAAEGLPLSFWHFFDPIGKTINAASVLPNLLRDFGDMSAILAEVAPRKVLLAAGIGKLSRQPQSVALTDRSFAETPATLLDWLGE
ncbi:MAG TPA: acetylxylan esterase [Gemmataceae bacterium]|nr:acetylxylan esterase [Gemmataceae bacterium]